MLNYNTKVISTPNSEYEKPMCFDGVNLVSRLFSKHVYTFERGIFFLLCPVTTVIHDMWAQFCGWYRELSCYAQATCYANSKRNVCSCSSMEFEILSLLTSLSHALEVKLSQKLWQALKLHADKLLLIKPLSMTICIRGNIYLSHYIIFSDHLRVHPCKTL